MTAKHLTFMLCTLLALGVVLAGCGPQAAPVTLTAALSELQGTVGIKQPGQTDFSAASADTTLVQDGQVQTGEDGRVRLDLSSGTIIRMAPSSLFTLVSNEEVDGGLDTKLQLEAGKIFIVLNGGSMDVETPSGVASVRGSYMSVWVDPVTLNVYVTCAEGRCHAANESGAVDFGTGEKTILFRRNDDGTYAPPLVEDMTAEDYQDWLDENPGLEELIQQMVEQAGRTLTAMAPTATEVPPTATQAAPTATTAPSETPEPTAIPTKRRLNPDNDTPVAPCDPCDYEGACWDPYAQGCEGFEPVGPYLITYPYQALVTYQY